MIKETANKNKYRDSYLFFLHVLCQRATYINDDLFICQLN